MSTATVQDQAATRSSRWSVWLVWAGRIFVPLTTAMLAWLGLFLRDERVRALLPFRRRVSK